jgi:hypothetical protein
VEPDAAEKAKLENEWKKMGAMGRDLQMKRLIATLAAVGVAAPFFVLGILILLGGIFVVSGRAFILGFGAMAGGVVLGGVVRKALWPRGQFA